MASSFIVFISMDGLTLKDFEKYNCRDVVRLCQPTYKKEALEKLNIKVHVIAIIATLY